MSVSREALVEFYHQHDPSKTDAEINQILGTYEGNQAGLLEGLRKKYGSAPSASDSGPIAPANLEVALEEPSSAVSDALAGGDLSRSESTRFDHLYDADGSGDLSPLEQTIKKYDTDKNGTFSIAEVKAIVQDMETAKKSAKNMGRLAGAILIVSLCLMGVLLGLMFAANEASKESHTDGGTQKDLAGNVVKMANDQMEVGPDGQMKSRADAGGRRLQDGTSGPETSPVMSIATATSEATLSSSLSDEAFTQMKTLRLDGPNSNEVFVSMNVLATARYRNKASRCGTIVVIYTHLGEVTLDGEDIYFEERITGAFAAAGFETTHGILESTNFGGRRRLNAAALLKGLFNAVANLKRARCEENANNIEGYQGLRDGPLPNLPTGDAWVINMNSYKECDSSTPAKREWCLAQPGVAPHPNDFAGKLFFVLERTISMGAAVISETKLSWDGTERTMKSMQSGTDVYNWETTDSGAMYNCLHNPDGPEPAPVAFEDTAQYHGDDFFVNGFPARKWTFKTIASDSKPTIVLEVWDRKSDNTLLRLRSKADPSQRRHLMDLGIDMRRALTSLEHDPKVEVDDIISLISTSGGAPGAVDVAPVFDTCINYADRVITNPNELDGAFEPLLQVHPTFESPVVPADDGSVTAPPAFVEEWEVCTNIGSANVYSALAADVIGTLDGWQVTLGQAKSMCFNSATCMGFSHNENAMTSFFSRADLATCGGTYSGVLKDPPAASGTFMTYRKTSTTRRKLAVIDHSGAVSWDLGGASFTATFEMTPSSPNFGSLTGLDICAGRRRLEEHLDTTGITEEEKIAFWKNLTQVERRLANSESMAEAKFAMQRRRKLLFSAGWAGCVKFTADPYEVNGCIEYSVSLFGWTLLSAEGCIGIGYCDGRTFVKFTMTLSVGDGWFFGGSVSATFRGIVNGPPGGCVSNNRAMDFGIGLSGVTLGWTYGTEFGPWGMGASGETDGDEICEDVAGFYDSYGYSCYWGWSGNVCADAAKPYADGGYAHYGYTQASQDAILENCKESCGLCGRRLTGGAFHNRRLEGGKTIEEKMKPLLKSAEGLFPVVKSFGPELTEGISKKVSP
jgi:hypothetical protein